MATKIGAAPSYFTDFAGGQGAGISNYFDYPDDHDTNATVVKATINQMIDEISALSGPNAVVSLDLVLWDDADNPISGAEQNEGVVGAASYEVSVEGGGTLKVKKGQAFVVGQRVSIPSTLTGLTSSGGSGTRWVAIDANGVVSIQDLAAQKALDIASVTWNGTIFTGTPTHLADVFFDGDSWAELRDRTAAGTSFPAVTFRRVSERFEALEQSLSAAVGGAALIALPPGVVGDPGLVFSDGAGAADTTTGWFRPAANVWAYAVAGVEMLRLNSAGIEIVPLGSAATPVIRIGAAADDGFYSPGVAQLSVALAGAQAFAFAAGYGRGGLGVVGAPAFSFLARTDTGLYSPAAGVVALSGGGELAIKAGSIAAGGVALPNILRCKATNAGGAPQNLTDATWEAIELDQSEAFDVGGWHDLGTNPSRFTCPTNGDGLYMVVAHAHFSDPGTPTNNRGIRFAINGTFDPSSEMLVPSTVGIETALDTTILVELVATDYVEVEAFEDGAGGVISVVGYMSIHRVA